MAVDLTHECHGAIADGDVQVFQQNGNLAHLINVFGVKRRIEKFPVKRHSARWRSRRLARGAGVVALAVAKVNSAALAGLRVRRQRRHPADGLHLVRSDLQSEQIAIEAQRALQVANADSNV